MGRYRSRSRSFSPQRSRSPPTRKHYEDPRLQRSQRHRPSTAPSSLLVRNVSLRTSPEELKIPFERFGPVKDVYMPKNYYTGEPRGFAFVKFHNPEDALESKEQLNRTIIDGREIRIVFAEENRKTPQEMRRSSRSSGRYGGSYRATTNPRSPGRQYRSYSRSASPARRYSSSPRERHLASRETYHREKRYRSSSRSRSPRENALHVKDSRFSRRSPRTREKSLLVEGDDRPPRRSDSPREFSPNVVHKKEERRSLSPMQNSPHHANTSKAEFSPRMERKGKPNEQSPQLDGSPDKLSPRNGRSNSRSGYRSYR